MEGRALASFGADERRRAFVARHPAMLPLKGRNSVFPYGSTRARRAASTSRRELFGLWSRRTRSRLKDISLYHEVIIYQSSGLCCEEDLRAAFPVLCASPGDTPWRVVAGAQGRLRHLHTRKPGGKEPFRCRRYHKDDSWIPGHTFP